MSTEIRSGSLVKTHRIDKTKAGALATTEISTSYGRKGWGAAAPSDPLVSDARNSASLRKTSRTRPQTRVFAGIFLPLPTFIRNVGPKSRPGVSRWSRTLLLASFAPL
jgi:hypothetical protein